MYGINDIYYIFLVNLMKSLNEFYVVILEVNKFDF